MRARLFLVSLALLTGCQCGGGDAPSVRILSPQDGARLLGTGPHALWGEVISPGALIPSERISWRSDRDGVLGNGAQASATLSLGAHRLTLEALDERGQAGSAQISVTVLAAAATDGGLPGTDGGADTTPVATITAPMSGAVFDEGQPIVLEGNAQDAEEGALPAASLSWSSDRAGPLGTGNRVTFGNAALGTHRVVLTATDRAGNAGLASTSFEVVRPGTNRAPTVTITQPAPGASLALGAPVSLQGSAQDPEDGALTGTSLRWSSSRDGALGTGVQVSATLTQGVHTLTLTATDSRGATGQSSVTVSVNQPNNRPPTVTITAPTTPPTLFEGTALTLSAAATDPEDGALPTTALAWTSSRDGALGTGSPLVTSTLTAGNHVVTVVATDAGGNTGTASIAVTVLPANQAPTVNISTPSSGTTVARGTMVSFSGTAQDPEDGALAATALRWSSSLDGSLGTGSPLVTASLSQGTHTITLSATDSGGRSASASISLTVTAGAMNVPPIARLVGPATGQATQPLTFDASNSSDSDGTITSFRFEFGDGTPAQTGAMTQATHAWATPGAFTVTLTVTDDRGATATATLAVAITAFVRVPVVATPSTSDVHSCGLATPGNRVFVAWTNDLHPSVSFGEWVNGSLQGEIVDSLGFNVGGVISRYVMLRVASDGTPHILYVRDDQPWYATRVSGNWVRERVDAANPAMRSLTNDSYPSLALDATNRPVVVYGTDLPYTSTVWGTRPVVAVRTAANTWTRTVITPAASTTSQYIPAGEVAVDGMGRVVFPVADTSLGRVLLCAVSGTSPATFVLSATSYSALGGWATTALAGSRLVLVSGAGVWDVTLNATWSALTARQSMIETFSVTQHAVALDSAGAPRVVARHDGQLESIRPGQGGLWVREGLGAVDDGFIDAAVDGANETRACFVRAGRLMIY